MDLITLIESWSAASPKTTCLPSSQEVTTVVRKNWEPLLYSKYQSQPAHLNILQDSRVWSRISHRQKEGLVVSELEILVGKLLAVYGFAASALGAGKLVYAFDVHDVE